MAHLELGHLAYDAHAAQVGDGSYKAWEDLGDDSKYAWAIAAHAVLGRALSATDHEAAIFRALAEPKTADDGEPPPLLPPPPVK